MSKNKHHKRKWIGQIRGSEPEFWITEDQVSSQFAFVQKLHPERPIEEAIQQLENDGFISTRIGSDGRREYRFNEKAINEARAKLPPEVRKNPREIKIYEDTAIICDYNNDMTTLLSVITQQTDKLLEHKSVIPWIVKTKDQIDYDAMGTVKDIQQALLALEAKNFVEVAQCGPLQYRYRLNVSVVQAAIDALPDRGNEDEA